MISRTQDILSPILFIPRRGSEETERLDLPDSLHNLFHRIIRDPTVPNRPARERQCTEMLCSVLMNCPILSDHVLRWLASMTDCPAEKVDLLNWRFSTERSIGSKRDDLRIEGFAQADDGEHREVLWTVEVKVGATFHESSAEHFGDAPEVDADRTVIQITNYDNWLRQLVVAHRAGFVLAIEDMTDQLPPGLSCRWSCLSWTDLGNTVRDALLDGNLPATEQSLARHLLGFVRENLWSNQAMSNDRLDLDHVALIRAFAVVGSECERIANDLVGPLEGVVRDSDLDLSEINHQKNLYGSLARSVVYGTLCGTSSNTVWVQAGIDAGTVRIWIETSPRHPQKAVITAACSNLLPELNESGSEWYTPDSPWRNLQISIPIVQLLAANDQTMTLQNLVESALADLVRVGVHTALRQIVEPKEAGI